ncbi:NAD-dependent epimerase/dehydratase family protein [Streptomyces canus]|uniref:dTDP-glucose 4,6-dehydratase n=1 Tax=Streptomyces canus TaxID=58343 RepID=A0AAW8FTT0_9ACTN|nr:NAD-dependent epimerase/dehydratase family protein [Streptomyces canus]MDQ0758968.1 dTDP-glucose 4,6-dehydratase [Streptomyces canus]MDQ0912416.1 dTDP-glucose 4,6-dehydratase [Streptomyces canus]
MRVLVTGGAGFIGSHYVRSMLDGRYPGWEEASVTVVDSLTNAGDPRSLPASHPRLTFVLGDVCDQALLDRIVPGHDGVVHFAAESHTDRSPTGAGSLVRTNVLGSQTLLESCLRAEIPRLVLVSTDEVYGTVSNGSWTEDAPLEPNSPYAASKASADLLARAYHRSHGVPVTITRCSSTYGPRQLPEKIIPLLVTRLLTGGTVPLRGDGLHVREWQHVDDHCRGIQLALEHGRPGAVYNLAGGAELTDRELTERLLALCGADWSHVEYTADRKGHDRRYALDGTVARDELGYEPRVSFEHGLADTVQWYRENRSWWATSVAAPVPEPRRRGTGRPRPTAAIVGADGFIGGRLLTHLGRDHGVAPFTRERPAVDDDGAPAPELRTADTVYYLATSVNPATAGRDPAVVAADHDHFLRLMDVLAALERPPLLVLASSGGTVYDVAAPCPYGEDAALLPSNAYGAAKLALEQALFARRAELPGIALRLSNVYGPGQRTGTGQGVVAHWLRAVAEGTPLRVIGDPATVRDYVYVDDVCAALAEVRAAHTAGVSLPAALNIGSGEGISLSDLLAVLEATVQRELSVEYAPRRSFDRRDAVLDTSRTHQVLGWRSSTPLPEGLARTWRSVAGPHAVTVGTHEEKR